MRFRLTSVCLFLAAAGVLPAAVNPVHAQEDTSSELVYQVQQLLEEVRELRGKVDSQQRELENLRRRQRDQYLDLDQRLQALERGGQGAPPEAERPSAPENESDEPMRPATDRQPEPADDRPAADVPEVREPIDTRPEVTPLPQPNAGEARELEAPGEEEQAAYDRAFRALRETRYADAAEGFSDFLQQHPDSSYAPNALYWLAETYYVTRDFQTALDYFNELLDRFPESSKQGDALLKIGFSHFELENWPEARAALEQVRSEYPGTTLARLAESRLRDMRLAGHY